MAQRKISISDKAIEEVAHVAYFIEGKGLPDTAKKFVDEAFRFFQKLSDPKIVHKPCSYSYWKEAGYRCAPFRKKFIVAYQELDNEILICDFASRKIVAGR